MDGFLCNENHEKADESNKIDFLSESLVIRGKSNGHEFRMLQSNKGKQSLVRCGFMYRLDHVGKDRVSWRCNNRGCSAQIKTDTSLQTILQDNEKPHTHAADADKLERQLLRAACKGRAISDQNTGLQEIIREEARRLGLVFMTTKETKFLQMAMYRQRRKSFAGSITKRQSDKQRETKKEKVIDHPAPIPVINVKMSASPNAAVVASSHLNDSQHSPDLFQAPFDNHFDLLADMAGDPNSFETKNPAFQISHAMNLTDLDPQNNIVPLQAIENFLVSSFEAMHPQSVLQTPQHGIEDIESSQHLLLEKATDSEQVNLFHEQFLKHEDMLLDNGVIMAFRRSLQENRSLLKGSSVIDVGAKTGLLSHFAMQAGASEVFAVEDTKLAECADRTVTENSAGSVITVLNNSIQDIDFQGEVQVLVSNWMGPCLLCESQLSSVIHARDQFLKQNGEMFPSSAALFLAPFTDTDFETRSKRLDQLKKLYGVSVENLMQIAHDSHTAKTEKRHLEMESIQASAVRLCNFNLHTVTLQQAQCIKSDFSFTCYGKNSIHGFVCWFTVAFPGSVCIDTSPFALKTHWGQTLMYLKSSIAVLQGTEITGTFTMQKGELSNRDWSIDICYNVNNGKEQRQSWKLVQ